MQKKTRNILKLSGKINPSKIEEYLSNSGYSALRNALKKAPSEIINEVIESGLRGRGGAGFPTGLKFKYTAQNKSSEIYIICNADEGEPGTFKDRILMETVPHSFIEGMIIAAYAIGATAGFIYVRGEYYDSIKLIKTAMQSAQDNNILGADILGSGFSFDIELKIGAGSYLCGEELTLIESLEGKRGHPRIKPPFPAEYGLWGKPTLINNVETFANIPIILKEGAMKYKSIGTEKSSGTKLFCLCGDVNKPGCYELPFGVTLRELIFEIGEGVPDGKKFKAALLGGAAGTFVNEELLDVKMAYETLAEKGLTLGSGAVIVINSEQKIQHVLNSVLHFFKHESCGKCVPCRVGTANLVSLSDAMITGNQNNSEIINELLNQSQLMAKCSLCPLGQSPVLPIKSAIQCFKEELLNT